MPMGAIRQAGGVAAAAGSRCSCGCRIHARCCSHDYSRTSGVAITAALHSCRTCHTRSAAEPASAAQCRARIRTAAWPAPGTPAARYEVVDQGQVAFHVLRLGPVRIWCTRSASSSSRMSSRSASTSRTSLSARANSAGPARRSAACVVCSSSQRGGAQRADLAFAQRALGEPAELQGRVVVVLHRVGQQPQQGRGPWGSAASMSSPTIAASGSSSACSVGLQHGDDVLEQLAQQLPLGRLQEPGDALAPSLECLSHVLAACVRLLVRWPTGRSRAWPRRRCSTFSRLPCGHDGLALLVHLHHQLVRPWPPSSRSSSGTRS